MPQKTFLTYKSKAGSEDVTINGKAATSMVDSGFVKAVHNNFSASNNNGNADYASPKNPNTAFENQYVLVDYAAVEDAVATSFDSSLTGTSEDEFMAFIQGLDWNNL